MFDVYSAIWFFVIFIPSIYLFYKSLQCFDYEKYIKAGRAREFKIVYVLICIILAFLFALAFTTVLEKIYSFIKGLSN